MRSLIVILAISITSPAVAQIGYDRILLPIALSQPQPGAFGSLWATEVTAYATGGVAFHQFLTPCGACFPEYRIGPGTTRNLPVAIGHGPTPPGVLIYVKHEDAPNLHLSLRLFDLSRQNLSWGVELPIVREKDFLVAPL